MLVERIAIRKLIGSYDETFIMKFLNEHQLLGSCIEAMTLPNSNSLELYLSTAAGNTII